MSEPSNTGDRSTVRGTDDPLPSEHLGAQPDELALFAIARRPDARRLPARIEGAGSTETEVSAHRTFLQPKFSIDVQASPNPEATLPGVWPAPRPLTDAQAENLLLAVRGTLPESLSASVRELVKRNAAASEFVLAEQLLAAANRSARIPKALSRRILTNARPAPPGASARWWPLRSWQFVGVGAAAAALAIALAFYGLNLPASRNFSVAALDDREILGEVGGTLTRGGQRPTEKTPTKSDLGFIEIDVRKGLLTSFFAEDQSGKRADEDATIARISGVLNEKQKVGFVFDAAITPLLTGDMGETLTLRVYDLSDTANEKLASRLRMLTVGKSYFLSAAR